MRQIYFILIFVSLTACNYFDNRKISSKAILSEELQAFNWNDVDEYPSFALCESLKTSSQKKDCFYTILSQHILSHLQKDSIVVSRNIKDTINLKIQISETGRIRLLSSKLDTFTIKEIPNINSLISHSLKTLPKIFPAIKRGQNVKTEFKLAIIIKVK